MSSGNDLFFYERNRNFVTERVILPEREQQIQKLERRLKNGKLKKFEALNVDKYIYVTNMRPCLTDTQKYQAVNAYYDYLYGKTNVNRNRF